MSKRRPPVIHASADGYPACGSKQRAWDVKKGIEGDTVSGMRPPTCEKCIEAVGASPRAVWAA